MTRSAPRSLAAATALLVLSFVAVLPLASASAGSDGAEVACPTLPLYDAALCWLGVALRAVNNAYDLVTCDVIGGPACGFDLCTWTGICTR